MTEAVLADALLMTFVIVGSWYVYHEWAALTRLLRSWGLPLPAPAPADPGGAGAAPGVTAAARQVGLLTADVEIAAIRLLATATGDLRLEGDVILRARPLACVTLKLGIFDASGLPFPPKPGARTFCRFEDGTDTLGGEIETAPAARDYAYWHAQGLTLARHALPPKDGRLALTLRAEVWSGGRKEAASRVHTVFELGARGPEPGAGPPCVACRVPGATYPCPRCREPHHEACYRLNQACTQLACATMAMPEPGAP